MKIQYMSDLHLEFGDMAIPERKGEILVLAGDIHVGTAGIPWINKCAEVFDTVVYVLGNHEHYHDDISTLYVEIAELIADNVVLLDAQLGEVAYINGTKFVGTTLWSDVDINAFHQMNDSRIINNGDEKFTYDAVLELHKNSMEFLREEVEAGCVLITHHAPSSTSVDMHRYGEDVLNTAYYTNILTEFADKKPAVWIHGHTHNCCSYVEHDILVVSNQRGYHNYDEVFGFSPTKIVTIEEIHEEENI